MWKILHEEYAGHVACNSLFVANINTQINANEYPFQCFLDKYKAKNNNTYKGYDPSNQLLIGGGNTYLAKVARQKRESQLVDVLSLERGKKAKDNYNPPHKKYKRKYKELNPTPQNNNSICTIL